MDDHRVFPQFLLSGILLLISVIGTNLVLGCGGASALEPQTERITENAVLEHKVGRVKLYGSGNLSSDTLRLLGGAEVRQLFNSPLFVTGEARFEQERRLPYDLHRFGGDVGLGWAFSDTTDVLATYRLDGYSVFHTGPNVDPAFQAVEGGSRTAAFGLTLRHDTRDDHYYPTKGMRLRFGEELALKAFGGDYDFTRLSADTSFYATPFGEHPTGTLLDDVTFVEHFRFGWVQRFGDTDEVPFFERYFVGGSGTVRGHRTRRLTPRGLEDQFIGGEIQLINNLEARIPVLPSVFNRQLSAAAFVDAGRAWRRFGDIGNFGYGIGGGLRYVVHLWKLNGVIRADYAFNIHREDDDSTGNFHLTFGIPF